MDQYAKRPADLPSNDARCLRCQDIVEEISPILVARC